MKKLLLFFMILSAILHVSNLVADTVLLSDNFNSYSVTGSTFTANSLWGSINGNTTDAILQVVQDTGNIFGEGTSNKYMRFDDTGTNITRMDAKPSSTFQIATLSFDMVEVSGVSGTSWFVGFYDSALVFQVKFNNGTINDSTDTLYSLGTAVHVDIVLNTSASIITYNGASSVASMTYDVLINNTLVLNDVAITGTTGTSLTTFKLTTPSSTSSQEIWLDNVVLTAIPELPFGLYLGGLFLGCYLGATRGGWHSRISIGFPCDAVKVILPNPAGRRNFE